MKLFALVAACPTYGVNVPWKDILIMDIHPSILSLQNREMEKDLIFFPKAQVS